MRDDTYGCACVISGKDQREYQSSASLAFVRGIHRGPVNSPHKRPVMRKVSPFDDVIMGSHIYIYIYSTIFRIKYIIIYVVLLIPAGAPSINVLATFHNILPRTMGLYFLGHETSQLEATRYRFRIMQSIWNLTGVSTAVLWRHISYRRQFF